MPLGTRFRLLQNEKWLLAILLLFLLVNELAWSDHQPFYHEEARRAIVAQEMMVTGNWAVPSIYGAPYYRKPPFHNWMIALVSLPFGEVTRTSTRFVSTFSFLVMILTMYVLLRRLKPELALTGAAMLATTYLLLMEFGAKAETDALFASLIFLSLAIWMVKPKGLLSLLLSSQMLGLAVLTKGIAPLFVYPAMVVALFINRAEWAKRLGWMVLHFLASLLPVLLWGWFYARQGDLHEMLRVLFIEASDRTTGSILPWLIHLVEFPVSMVIVLLPWSLVLFVAWRKGAKAEEWVRIHAITFLLLLGSFALLPGMIDRYLIPAIPSFILAAVFYLDRNKPIHPALRTGLFILILLGAIFAGWYQLFVAGHIVAGIVLFGTAVLIWFLLREKFTLPTTMIVLMLLALVVYRHGLILHRGDVAHDYRATAEKLVSMQTDEYPCAVSRNLSFKVGVNLMALRDEPVLYAPFLAQEDSLWFVATAEEKLLDVPEAGRIVYPGRPHEDIVLQKVAGSRFEGITAGTTRSK